MNIKNEIKEAFTDNKKIFYVLIIIFIIAIFLGYMLTDYLKEILMPLLKEAMNSTDISENDALNILVHNETTAILTLISSIFFAVMPVLSIFVNGFAVGFLAGYTIDSTYKLAMFFVLIAPHGIFEIPALLCTCTSGILLFLSILRILQDKINGFTFKESYNNNKKTLKQMIILFIIAMLLFLIAAIVEGYITPYLGNVISLQFGQAKIFG